MMFYIWNIEIKTILWESGLESNRQKEKRCITVLYFDWSGSRDSGVDLIFIIAIAMI